MNLEKSFYSNKHEQPEILTKEEISNFLDKITQFQKLASPTMLSVAQMLAKIGGSYNYKINAQDTLRVLKSELKGEQNLTLNKIGLEITIPEARNKFAEEHGAQEYNSGLELKIIDHARLVQYLESLDKSSIKDNPEQERLLDYIIRNISTQFRYQNPDNFADLSTNDFLNQNQLSDLVRNYTNLDLADSVADLSAFKTAYERGFLRELVHASNRGYIQEVGFGLHNYHKDPHSVEGYKEIWNDFFLFLQEINNNPNATVLYRHLVEKAWKNWALNAQADLYYETDEKSLELKEIAQSSREKLSALRQEYIGK